MRVTPFVLIQILSKRMQVGCPRARSDPRDEGHLACLHLCILFAILPCSWIIIAMPPTPPPLQDGISHKLVQYQFMGWMENNFPRVPDFVKFVCDVLHGVRNIKGNKKVLMHDTYVEREGEGGRER